MDRARREQLASDALDGYDHGPDATVAARSAAVLAAASARCIVLVEGVSDQIALETLARRLGRDLATERVVVMPIGGAQAAPRAVLRLGPSGTGARLAGMFDVGEERFVRRALRDGRIGVADTRREMERLGFFLCVADLEDELIRASGRAKIERVLDSQGDLEAFRTLQRQPNWRGAPFDAQFHRWLRAGARRNLRYARLLMEAIDLDRVPGPLAGVLAVSGSVRRAWM